MKTIQEYLREAERARLLSALAYFRLCDPLTLLEYQEMKITEIQNDWKKRMNDLIEQLLSIKPVPTDHMVFYIVPASSIDKQFAHDFYSMRLIDLNEIREDIYATSYAFELTPWEKTLGYLVADNKLTQDHMIDLLSQYLHDTSFFGTEEEKHKRNTEEIIADLDRSLNELDAEKCKPADVVFEEIARKYGLPIDEDDEKQNELRRLVTKAEIEFSRYCNWRERRRILESMGEKVPEFKPDEKVPEFKQDE